MVKKLMYPRGNLECFSDYELVLLQIPDKEEQMRLLRALSERISGDGRRAHPPGNGHR